MSDQLAQKIRAARNEAGLTREQLAPKLGIVASTLRNWETGRTTRISLEDLVALGKATGHPLSYFLDSDETEAVAS